MKNRKARKKLELKKINISRLENLQSIRGGLTLDLDNMLCNDRTTTPDTGDIQCYTVRPTV